MKRGFVALCQAVLLASVVFWGEAASAEADEALPPEPGAAASESRVSFYGYGELHYNHPKVDGLGFPAGDLPPTLDYHRLVLGWSYAFNDRLSIHAEVEWGHAGQEIELEFAYLDYQWKDAINFRGGSVLMPVGPLNEFHEPTLFYSVERPYVQKYIIPTTWQEAGIGIYGQPLPGVSYRLYLVEGLDASGFSENGIGETGRQILSEDTNRAFNFGGVGRLEYTGIPGLAAGASYYSAGAGQGTPGLGKARLTLWDIDARGRFMGFDLTGVYVQTHVSDADRISAVVDAVDPSNGTVGSKEFGWYLEAAYHLATLTKSQWDWVPFIRYEKFDTQSAVPSGFAKNPATDRKVTTYGLAFYPHPDVALKADHEVWKDGTGADAARTNLALAFMF